MYAVRTKDLRIIAGLSPPFFFRKSMHLFHPSSFSSFFSLCVVFSCLVCLAGSGGLVVLAGNNDI